MNEFDLGIDYFYKKEYEKALSYFLVALAQDQCNRTHYYNVALAYEALNETDLAIAYYKKAVSLFDVRSMNNLALIYFKSKNEEEALELLNKAIEVSPNDAEAYCQFGTYYAEKRDFKMAEMYYIKARNLDINFFYNYYKLGLLYIETKDLTKAKENLQKSIEINQNFKPAQEELSKLQ